MRSRAVLAGRTLRAAGAHDRAVLLGPFVGEIGYELEYWIPFLRRELRRHGIEREQATVLTRGGAALWYRDFAAHAVDVARAALGRGVPAAARGAARGGRAT